MWEWEWDEDSTRERTWSNHEGYRGERLMALVVIVVLGAYM